MPRHDPGPPEYVRLARFYDLLLEPVLHPMRRAVARTVAASPARRILDVGCGTGRQLRMLPADRELHGIDLSLAMLRRAERQVPGRCRHGDATDLPFEDASFDLVLTQLALHEKDAAVVAGLLREARRVLRPDGRLLVVDYAVGPHRWPLGPLAHRVIAAVEGALGGEHAANYRAWMARGGIDAVVPAAGFREIGATPFWGGPIKMGVYAPAG